MIKDFITGIFKESCEPLVDKEMQIAVRNLLQRKCVKDNGLKTYYEISPKEMRFMLHHLKHEKPNANDWRKIHLLARKSDNREFDPPKSPIVISLKHMNIVEGMKRMIAVAVAKKPALLWIDVKED